MSSGSTVAPQEAAAGAPRAATGGSRVLLLGLVTLLAAWTFGSLALATVALGLFLAGAGATIRARLARGAVVERVLAEGACVEGDDVRVQVAVRRRRLLSLGGGTVRQPLGRHRTAEAMLSGGRCTIVHERLARGRYLLPPAEVALRDPLGLARTVVSAGPAAVLVVRPAIVEVQTLFTDRGRRVDGGRTSPVRRETGFELHAVREHHEGESLRSVHWPSTARLGRLMVKELDDAPRDDVVVVLDQDPAGCTGPAGASSFDAAVRAAGALVRAHAARGRRVGLLFTGNARDVVRVASLERDWEEALVALAVAEADASAPLAGVLAAPRGAAVRAPELVVVTCLAGAAAELVASRRCARSAGLVLVDAPTFAGAAPSASAAAVLRAAAAGVRVAVVRRGDDLRAVLDGSLGRRASGASARA